MGKTLEQLGLTDTPIAKAEPIDPRGTDWYRFSEEIDELLATGQYTWAETTLTDIQATVNRTHSVSDGQRRAVQNIETARSRSRTGGYGRRYEGYGGGRR